MCMCVLILGGKCQANSQQIRSVVSEWEREKERLQPHSSTRFSRKISGILIDHSKSIVISLEDMKVSSNKEDISQEAFSDFIT